ncbi:MAG: hydrogenase formation protein HypD [Phycisphaeraceae bacterium]|nr:hydrogenase formation protein HypD [Phycisphaeraceae bacterium]
MPSATDLSMSLLRLRSSAASSGRELVFMEVCGTHTTSAFRSGLHSLMPDNVTLLSGPGCPVCVTAQGDIDLLIELAQRPNVTLCTYGDMLRVPGARGSLESARGGGAAIRIVYSALDALSFAEQHPDRQVVLASVGFETTAPGAAAAILTAQRRHVTNFTVLASHKRVVPAMLALLHAGEVRLDGFLCPGHVSVIIGSEVYRPIVRDHGLPCVVAGFEPRQMAAALAELSEQACDHRAELVNQYVEAVTPTGNHTAQRLLDEVFEPAEVRWRGLSAIPGSGLVIRSKYQSFDAQSRFNLAPAQDQEPKGCLCGQVITGRVTPRDCKLFGTACTPVHPIGPCMVSSEGTCQAWFKYQRAGAPTVRSARQEREVMT